MISNKMDDLYRVATGATGARETLKEPMAVCYINVHASQSTKNVIYDAFKHSKSDGIFGLISDYVSGCTCAILMCDFLMCDF